MNRTYGKLLLIVLLAAVARRADLPLPDFGRFAILPAL